MARAYDVDAIETKWQARWQDEGTYEVDHTDPRPPFYALCMYPYPSGPAHQGHVRNYTFGDVLVRYRTMLGHAVLSPFGFDSFGLPAENAAIKDGIHPRISTEQNIEAIERQMHRLGWAIDWSRVLSSHRPDYYRWTQWLFLKFREQGLAYRKKSPVNWCPQDQTVLANEQVVDGRCERCGAEVTKRELTQWYFKITDYAEIKANGIRRTPGLLLHGQHLVLDFSSRPFDRLEFTRMIALAEQLLAHLPPWKVAS